MKFLVTGAAGFIGFYVSKRLLAAGHQVVGIDNLNDYYDVNLKQARLDLLKHDNFSFYKIDLADREKMATLFADERFDRVINLAAQAGVRYSLENPNAYADANLIGFLNVLEGCRHNNVQHLLYASSSSVYGMNRKMPFSTDDSVDHPVSLYAATKKRMNSWPIPILICMAYRPQGCVSLRFMVHGDVRIWHYLNSLKLCWKVKALMYTTSAK